MPKKYTVTRPFIAFGRAPVVGELVFLTDEQAAVLLEADAIAPLEVKVEPPPAATKKKSVPSAPAVRASRKKTAKKSQKK